MARGAAPVLLCCIAGLQIYLSSYHDLTVWKGGGFGMFSDFRHRRIVVQLLTEEGPVRLDRRGPLRWVYRRVEAFPSEANMRRVVDAIVARDWVWKMRSKRRVGRIYLGDPARLDESRSLSFDAVKLQVWLIRYDRELDALRSELVVERTLEVPP